MPILPPIPLENANSKNPPQNSDIAREITFFAANSTSSIANTNFYNDWEDHANRLHRGIFVQVSINDVHSGSTGEFIVSIDSGIATLATTPPITSNGHYWFMMHPDVKQNTNNYIYGHLPRLWTIGFKSTGDRQFDGSIITYYIL